MYYSTPGALKVQGLAARKVTTGSPLNSCKLLAGFGEAGWRGGKGMEHGFGRVACTRVFFINPPHTPLVWKEFFSWMLEALQGTDYIVIWLGLSKTACLLVFLSVLVVG